MSTLKTGDNVTIKDTGEHSIIKEIDHGKYLLADEQTYWSWQIKSVKKTPVPKKKKAIKPFSPFRSVLTEVYNILNLEYLEENKVCMAKLAGCSHKATEVHHKYKRTGYYLIMDQLWLPICANCHGFITEDSETAIELGLSISRMTVVDYRFTERVRELMNDFDVKMP